MSRKQLGQAFALLAPMLNENTETVVREEVHTVAADDVLDLLLAWHTHVIHTEGPAGLHAFLCMTAPRYLSMIAPLRARHREISHRIEHLHRMLSHSDAGFLAAEYEAICHEIEMHDDLESELLADAIENV